ncbi:hypothetical protein BV22DRAFT_97656 [Leucogyrophana mollusca]|uniref:Uncharacterized protein n=1 Tax=Leucogyrophana mollusca TaxID=85980 RepID=A0ACB8BY90_9AGAM|nr:hypothetical protein BV22DRAFT_97656 [Leucogyrophana mollusca]
MQKRNVFLVAFSLSMDPSYSILLCLLDLIYFQRTSVFPASEVRPDNSINNFILGYRDRHLFMKLLVPIHVERAIPLSDTFVSRNSCGLPPLGTGKDVMVQAPWERGGIYLSSSTRSFFVAILNTKNDFPQRS